MIRILGIDPGSRITGYGIVEEIDRKLHVVTAGVLKVYEQAEFSDRLKELYCGIETVIQTYKPAEVAMETIFFAKNAKSAIKLGQARGTLMTVVVNNWLKLTEYTPTQIKQAIVGHGHADKKQMQKMISLMTELKEPLSFDATDALAVAICHLNSMRMNKIKDNHDWQTSR